MRSLFASGHLDPVGGRVDGPEPAALGSGKPSYTEVLAAHARVVQLTGQTVAPGVRGDWPAYYARAEERSEAEAAFRRLLREVCP